jgi:tetratricopeptide (TPR) repeat protein
MPIFSDPENVGSGSRAAICLTVVFIISFASSVSAQYNRPPDPDELKELIENDSRSELYINWNYYASGTKAPTKHWVGPMEGGPPDPRRIEERLNYQLQVINKEISADPNNAALYEQRGETYLEFYDMTVDRNVRAGYAGKAMADLLQAIKLDPKLWSAYEKRARLLSRADFFGYFDVILSDRLEAIRLSKDLRVKFPEPAAESAKSYDAAIHSLSFQISNAYLNRAKALSSEPNLLAEVSRLHKQYAGYTPWKDFDTAIDHGVKNVSKPNEVWIPTGYFSDKGDAAYLLARYKIALDAYNAGKKYWDKNCEVFREPCDSNKKYMEGVYNQKLAKVYVKLEKMKTALAYLNRHLSVPNNTYCPEPFRVRARVYRQMGKTGLALADEQTASQLPGPVVSCYNSIQDWQGLY